MSDVIRPRWIVDVEALVRLDYNTIDLMVLEWTERAHRHQHRDHPQLEMPLSFAGVRAMPFRRAA